MLPDQLGELDSEIFSRTGSSSLPVTDSLQDLDNLGITSHFLYLVHGRKCYGRPHPDEDSQPCLETCVFWQYFRNCAIHYTTCEGVNCTAPHCMQAVALHDHWNICDVPSCFICTAIVNLILENLCTFLGQKDPKYDAVILQIKTASLETRKAIIRENVQRSFLNAV